MIPASNNGSGPLLIAVATLLLAMHGEPEPPGDESIDNVVERFDRLTERWRRGELQIVERER